MPFVTVGQENSAPIELHYEDHGSGRPVLDARERGQRATAPVLPLARIGRLAPAVHAVPFVAAARLVPDPSPWLIHDSLAHPAGPVTA